MNSIYASLSILLAEVSLILLIICGALIFIKLRDQRKDKKALLALTEKLKGSEEDRLNVLSIKLKETLNLEGDTLATVAKEIHNKELGFYIETMNIYADRDSGSLENLDNKIAALTESYSTLGTITPTASDTVTPGDSSKPSQETTELKHENTRLRQELETSKNIILRLEGELSDTKQEMRETVAEFVSAFSGGRDSAEENMSDKMKEKISATEKPFTTNEAAEPGNEDNQASLDDNNEDSVAPETTSEGETMPSELSPTSEDETAAAAPPPPDENPSQESADEENPFLSIDEDSSPGADNNSGESSIDRAMDETDLDADLAIDTDSPAMAQSEPDPTPNPAPESLNENEAPETAMDTDDIDAILAASANEKTEAAPASDESAAALDDMGNIEAITTDDIDAILEDIDMTNAETLSEEKKVADKTV